MTLTIKFQDPPRPPRWVNGPSDETFEIIEALKANPGKWALIKQDTYPSVTTRWKKRPGIEAKSSNVGKTNGKWDIYARYIGEGKGK